VQVAQGGVLIGDLAEDGDQVGRIERAGLVRQLARVGLARSVLSTPASRALSSWCAEAFSSRRSTMCSAPAGASARDLLAGLDRVRGGRPRGAQGRRGEQRAHQGEPGGASERRGVAIGQRDRVAELISSV
jgi:hypothetical protein